MRYKRQKEQTIDTEKDKGYNKVKSRAKSRLNFVFKRCAAVQQPIDTLAEKLSAPRKLLNEILRSVLYLIFVYHYVVEFSLVKLEDIRKVS